ncbi:MAG: DUF4419 domain-containing protein [Planctomycetes bacterium]|nr:DUF4419 domain-containing protein [Planctomycetota bacterium]
MTNPTNRSGITFSVDAVPPATKPLSTEPAHAAVKRFFERPVESCSDYTGECVWGVTYHPLYWAVHMGYSEHRPIVLSPDMVWLTIVQGLAQHVRNNKDDLWHHFAGADVEPVLTVVREDIVRGSPENLWSEVIADLAQQVGTYLPEIRNQLVPTFSTTGVHERAAFEVALLEVVLPFYLYQVSAICGIPQVTLEGTPEDWMLLRERVGFLRRFDLDWWLDGLEPVCDEFIAAAKGVPDIDHWRRIYHKDPACGGTEFNGWIGHLVPYVRDQLSNQFDQRNPLLDSNTDRIKLASLPTPLSRVPFRLERRAGVVANQPMEFLAGMIGVEQDEQTLALRPKIGWAVRELTPLERIEKQFDTVVPPQSPSEMARQYQRLTSLPRPPHALKQFYAVCDGGTVSDSGRVAFTFLPMSKLEPLAAEAPLALFRGEYEGRLCLVPFCRLADGRMAALALGFGYEHHGAVVVLPPGLRWGERVQLVADRFENFLAGVLDSPSRAYFDMPAFELVRLEIRGLDKPYTGR